MEVAKGVTVGKKQKRAPKSKAPKKNKLVQNIVDCLNEFKLLCVFSVDNMRNSRLKTIRENDKNCRFFIGSNKVMRIALKDYMPDIEKFDQQFKGEVGLLFTKYTLPQLNSKLVEWVYPEFARAGNISSEDVTIPEGEIEGFNQSMESQLRQLKVPIIIRNGKLFLEEEFYVCSTGETLTSTQCAILKTFNYKMAEFKINPIAMYKFDKGSDRFVEIDLA